MIKNIELYIPEQIDTFIIEGKLSELVTSNNRFRIINNSIRQAIRWENQGKQIVLENQEGHIQGYVSTDWKYVLATHYKTPGIEKPRNAIVYNADGSIHLYLEPEKLLTNEPKDRWPLLLRGMSFGFVGWYKNSKEETVLGVAVYRFFGSTTEVWEVNPETGEFGEFLWGDRDK